MKKNKLVTSIKAMESFYKKDFNIVRDTDLEYGNGLWDAETKAYLDAVTLKSLFFSEDWVYICVDLVARKISSQQLRVIRSTVQDGKYIAEPAVNHPVQKLIESPNKWQDYHAWMYVTVVDLCLIGNFIQWTGKTKDILVPIPAENVQIDFDKNGVPRGYLATEYVADGELLRRDKSTAFPMGEIVHGRQPNPSSMLWGLSSFTALRKQILFNRYSSEYLNNFYLKGATPGIALELSADANEHVALRLLRSFESAYTGRRNQRRTLVMPKGVTAKPISHSLADQQLIDFIDKNREVIINALKIPKHELSLQGSGSLGSEEYKTALKNFWSSTLVPSMRIIAGSLTKALESKLGPNHYLEFDISDVEVLQESLDAKAKLAKEMLATKTLNEVRAMVWNDPPLTGGDETPGASQPFPNIGLSASQKAVTPKVQEVVDNGTALMPDISAKAEKIKAGKWFTERQKMIKEQATKSMNDMEKLSLDVFSDMALGYVRAVKANLEEKAADITSKTEMKRRLQKLNGKFEEKWTKDYVKYLEAVVDVGYDAQLKMPFKLPNQSEIAALKQRNEKKRREILEARGLESFSNISATTTNKVLDIVEAGVEEGKSVDQIAQDVSKYMRNSGEELASRAMTIARTETLTAASLGQAAAMADAAEVVPNLQKMWINLGDEYVRGNPDGIYPKSEADHWEMQGEVTPWDEEFSNGLQFPRDPASNKAGEVINCRCTFITLPKEMMDNIGDFET